MLEARAYEREGTERWGLETADELEDEELLRVRLFCRLFAGYLALLVVVVVFVVVVLCLPPCPHSKAKTSISSFAFRLQLAHFCAKS